MKKNGDKARGVWGKMEESQGKTCHGKLKTSVEEGRILKSSFLRSAFYFLLLSFSVLGIPKRRKSSSKLSASPFVAKETSIRIAQKLTVCIV